MGASGSRAGQARVRYPLHGISHTRTLQAHMAVIRITRNHSLSRAHIRAHIEGLTDELQRKLNAQCRWDGDTAHFSRTGAKGAIHLDEGRIDIEITLGLALSPLKSQVEKTVNERLDRLLA